MGSIGRCAGRRWWVAGAVGCVVLLSAVGGTIWWLGREPVPRPEMWFSYMSSADGELTNCGFRLLIDRDDTPDLIGWSPDFATSFGDYDWPLYVREGRLEERDSEFPRFRKILWRPRVFVMAMPWLYEALQRGDEESTRAVAESLAETHSIVGMSEEAAAELRAWQFDLPRWLDLLRENKEAPDGWGAPIQVRRVDSEDE